jgi:hypothetical protein
VASHRSLWATPTGCWISGPDGTYRVDATDETGRQVSTAPATVGAVHGEAFLACTTTQPWLIHTPDGDPIEVIDTPQGSPIAAVADADTFAVLLRRTNPTDSQRYQLVRIALTGTCQIGPPLPVAEENTTSDLCLLGSPLTIACEDTFTDITTDLTAGATRHIPRRFFRAGALGDHLWTIGHPPDTTSRSWWPLDSPTVYDRSRGQFWLLTILDRVTLQPVHTAAVLTSQPELTDDDHGTIWLTTSGKLERIVELGGTMAWPETVDVTATERN